MEIKLFIFLFFLSKLIFSQSQIDKKKYDSIIKYWLELAKKYEVWDPEPKKIEPGIYGSPPSDAIGEYGDFGWRKLFFK